MNGSPKQTASKLNRSYLLPFWDFARDWLTGLITTVVYERAHDEGVYNLAVTTDLHQPVLTVNDAGTL